MASFQAIIGWKSLRKGENRKNRSDESLPDTEQRIPKKQEKNLKNLKTPSWILFKPKQNGKGWEREKIKNIIPMSTYRTWNKKFLKNSKKVQKIKKYNYGFFSSLLWLEMNP